MPVKVNGSPAGSGEPGSYLVLDRTWKNGDQIAFILPIDFKVTKYTGIEPGFEDNHYALEYGPVLMAMVGVKARKDKFGVKTTPGSIKKLLKPMEGNPLRFAIEGESEFEYWPYFEVQDEPFTCFPEFFK